MITGICAVSGSLVSCRVAWKPLSPGITMSISTASGFSCRASATPSAPFSALSTSNPFFSSMPPSLYSSVGESSTTSMRAIYPPGSKYYCRQLSGLRRAGHILVRLRNVSADSTQQLFLAEWLGQVLIGTHDAPLGLVEQPVLARQHDHWRGTECGVVLDQGTGLITIKTRHHDVNKYDIGVVISDLG